jgi:transposase
VAYPANLRKEEKMYRVLVGVDVSKNLFSAAVLDQEGGELVSASYEMNANGFNQFLKTLSSQCEELDQILVAKESTGCYQINLYSFLGSQGIRTLVVNPLLIANFAKLSLRKTKMGKKDALTIARFLLDHNEEISQLSISQDHQDLRDLSRERESLCHLISATKAEIKGVLRMTFPEPESIGNLYTGVMLRFLQQYPPARLVRGAKLKVIVKALKGPYMGQTDLCREGYHEGSPALSSCGESYKGDHSSGQDCYAFTP